MRDDLSDRSCGHLRSAGDRLPQTLPKIRLRHGQVLWLLTELGYRGDVSESAFYEYIKSLRKLGIPFGRARFQTRPTRRLAGYSYCHLMELTMTLSLRVYHVVPDAVLRGIKHYRRELYRFYRRAYAQRRSGAGTLLTITITKSRPIELRGLFLDLNIEFSGGRLLRFGPPKLLSPAETLARFSEGTSSGRAFIPLSLSLLSERVISLALRAPVIRSGPPKSSSPAAQPSSTAKRMPCRHRSAETQ